MNFLVLGGCLSLLAAMMHIGIIIGGASWYRFFGAGEQMALLAEQKSMVPVMVTSAIAVVLAVFGLYAFSAAGLITKLPFSRWVLYCIAAIYLARALAGLILPHISNHPSIEANTQSFWFVSSLICLGFGIVHLLGIRQLAVLAP